jgi:hypothetical protein
MNKNKEVMGKIFLRMETTWRYVLYVESPLLVGDRIFVDLVGYPFYNEFTSQ